MLMRKVILMLALGLTCSSALAEWTEVGNSESFTAYVNLSSIRNVGNKVKMWTLYDYKTVQYMGEVKYLSNTAQEEYDCIEETHRNIAINQYTSNMGKGDVVFTGDIKGEPSPIPPDTVIELLWKVACDKH